MKTCFFCIALSVFLIDPTWAAQSISKKSARSLSIVSLCEERAKRDYSEDWKSVSIIVNEIASRESVDVEMCDRIGEEALVNQGKGKRKRYSGRLSGESLSVYSRALLKTRQTYSARMIEFAIAQACGDEAASLDIEEIENFSVNDIPKRYSSIASIVSNYWQPYITGYVRALEATTAISPDLCEQEGRKLLLSRMHI